MLEERADFAGLDAGVDAVTDLLFDEAGTLVTVAVQLDANGTLAETLAAAAAVAEAADALFLGEEKAGVVLGIWFEEKTMDDMVDVVVREFLFLDTDPDLDRA